MTETQWAKPKPVSDLILAFSANVIGEYLPLETEIPDDFYQCGNQYNRIVSKIFFGSTNGWDFLLKDGIDLTAFSRHIKVCLGSFEPKHEHKIAGVAYLFPLWCEEIREPGS